MGKVNGSDPGDGRRNTAPPLKIDLDRLVWDQEYRAEIRKHFKDGKDAAGRIAPWPPPETGVD